MRRSLITLTVRNHALGRTQPSKRLFALNPPSHAIVRPQTARYALNLRDPRSFHLDSLNPHHGAQAY